MDANFRKAWALLTAAYPQAPQATNRETAALYARTLADLPADLLEAAVLSAIGACKFFPTVAELRDLAFSAVERAGNLPAPSEAWGDVMDAVSAIGYYRTPNWKVEAIAEAVRAIGGWEMLCQSENSVADRARFIEAYGAIVQRARTDARQLPQVREALSRLTSSPRAENVRQLLAGAVKRV